MSAGKGMAPTKGYSPALYLANYDRIFRKARRVSMSRPVGKKAK